MPIGTLLGGQSQTGGPVGTLLGGQDTNEIIKQLEPKVGGTAYGYGTDSGFYGHMTVNKANSPVEIIGNAGKAFDKITKEDTAFKRASNLSGKKGDCRKAK